MRSWIKIPLGIMGFAASVGLVTLGVLAFATVSDVYVVKNPTQEQVEALIKGDPNNRVWFDDATQLYQGSSLIKISFKARFWEGSRIPEFFEEVGVEYELIKEGK